MKQLTLIFTLFLFIFHSFSQIQHGGTPYSFLNPSLVSDETITLPEIDFEKLHLEDEIFDLQKDIPYRFGKNFNVDYNYSNTGVWSELKNGDRVWKASFYSEGALALNFLLENYSLATGATLFFYNNNHSSVLGGFTEKNNQIHKNLATSQILGDFVSIEFYEPKAVIGLSTFEITRITHGYRSVKIPTKAVGDAGNCNNNVICDVGDNWRDQIRSVGIIIVNGNGNCTGALVNNTCEDKKAYFLTADHCIGGNVTTWNIGFNWESSTCIGNNGYNGISNQSINVLALRASNGGSDFALVELTTAPPNSYNVFYAGWDNSGNAPSSQVGIHHPRGDLKKISFDNQAASTANWGGAQTWHIADWEDGTTEPGSSGSPLFDQNKRVIGQLYGGTASCNNNIDDYYGRFDVSWDGGTSAANELQSWLDPCNTNASVLNGLDGLTVTENDIAIDFINKPSIQNCGSNITHHIRLKNNGTNPVTEVEFLYGLDSDTSSYLWTGLLNVNDSVILFFDKITLCEGSYSYTLEIKSSNLLVDQFSYNDSDNFSFSVENGSPLQFVLKSNLNSSENEIELYTDDNILLYSYNNFIANEFDTLEYCLPKGGYFFQIYDSGNNGLTPTSNNDSGFYQLYIEDVLIHSNSSFGAEESTFITSEANGLRAEFLTANTFTETPFTINSFNSENATSYLWTAIGSTNSSDTLSSFTTSYIVPDTYPIVFKIENDTACDIISKNIEVLPKPNNTSTVDLFFNSSIYPNPSFSFINIETQNFMETTVKMVNPLGQVVFAEKMSSSSLKIKTYSFPFGIFFVLLENKENIQVNKITINY